MRHAGPTSWEISVDEPENLAFGLFIRDIAGLSSAHTWLPAATPAVHSAVGGSKAAARQWDRWWDQAIGVHSKRSSWSEASASWWAPPNFTELDAAPDLQALVRLHLAAARQWCEDRQREHMRLMIDPGRGLNETTVVAELEHACGQRARPFSLRVTEIPVVGSELWQLEADHVVVTVGLLRDPDEYRRRLTPVLQPLL